MDEQKGIVGELATSLGFMVIAVGVVIVLALVMKEIYYCPPERDYGKSPNGVQSRQNIAVPLVTNPIYRWHPSNIYHHR